MRLKSHVRFCKVTIQGNSFVNFSTTTPKKPNSALRKVARGVLVRCILLSKTCIVLRGYHVNRCRHVEGVADPITKVS
ncbi:unnamed protein product [Sphagnum troendelagicum]|uniref:Uncharacterized protein n=1 Tax=Sphagnum troendelagicum TaxID=128251 RepID=A0ABP0T6Z1_9BRYO